MGCAQPLMQGRVSNASPYDVYFSATANLIRDVSFQLQFCKKVQPKNSEFFQYPAQIQDKKLFLNIWVKQNDQIMHLLQNLQLKNQSDGRKIIWCQNDKILISDLNPNSKNWRMLNENRNYPPGYYCPGCKMQCKCQKDCHMLLQFGGLVEKEQQIYQNLKPESASQQNQPWITQIRNKKPPLRLLKLDSELVCPKQHQLIYTQQFLYHICKQCFRPSKSTYLNGKFECNQCKFSLCLRCTGHESQLIIAKCRQHHQLYYFEKNPYNEGLPLCDLCRNEIQYRDGFIRCKICGYDECSFCLKKRMRKQVIDE